MDEERKVAKKKAGKTRRKEKENNGKDRGR